MQTLHSCINPQPRVPLQPKVKRRRSHTSAQLWAKFVEDPHSFQDLREIKMRKAAVRDRAQPAPKLPDFVHTPTGDGLWMHTADMPPEAHAALSMWDMHAADRAQQALKVRVQWGSRLRV